jgi:hypothetical protein
MAPAKRSDISPERRAQLDRERARSHAIRQAVLDGAASDQDSLLACSSVFGIGASSRYPFDIDRHVAIQRARDDGYTWLEVAAACGINTEDPAAVERFKHRENWRAKTRRTIDAGQINEEDIDAEDEDEANNTGGMPNL